MQNWVVNNTDVLYRIDSSCHRARWMCRRLQVRVQSIHPDFPIQRLLLQKLRSNECSLPKVECYTAMLLLSVARVVYVPNESIECVLCCEQNVPSRFNTPVRQTADGQTRSRRRLAVTEPTKKRSLEEERPQVKTQDSESSWKGRVNVAWLCALALNQISE
jgi:hypothetical protein